MSLNYTVSSVSDDRDTGNTLNYSVVCDGEEDNLLNCFTEIVLPVGSCTSIVTLKCNDGNEFILTKDHKYYIYFLFFRRCCMYTWNCETNRIRGK